VRGAGELAEAEFHHPDISFGWGYATVSLRTKKIKGLHENDFIMAVKLDRLASPRPLGTCPTEVGGTDEKLLGEEEKIMANLPANLPALLTKDVRGG
jgi:Pterin 4 alpha carbinolamine dehydratase